MVEARKYYGCVGAERAGRDCRAQGRLGCDAVRVAFHRCGVLLRNAALQLANAIPVVWLGGVLLRQLREQSQRRLEAVVCLQGLRVF